MGGAQGHLKGAFVSFLTLLAAIEVPKLLSGVSGSDPSWQLITYSLLVYLVLDFTLPGRLLDGAQGELFAQQYRLLPLTVGACLCAPLIFEQFLQGQSLTLGLVPFLFACQFAAPGVLMEEKAQISLQAEGVMIRPLRRYNERLTTTHQKHLRNQCHAFVLEQRLRQPPSASLAVSVGGVL